MISANTIGFPLLVCGLMFMGEKDARTFGDDKLNDTRTTQIIKLPEPRKTSNISVEEALLRRRSIREYVRKPITIAEVAQLLWAAQGISDRQNGLRTAPSAGALYPLEVYLVSGEVKNITKGVYKYQPGGHELLKVSDHDIRDKLCRAALGQESISQAAIVLVFSAVFERTAVKYGKRAIQYVHMEIGHAAQNVYLQAVALKLGTVAIGAFQDDEVKKCVGLKASEVPLYIMPIGKVQTSP